jgi:PAS domain S-box-containing protein
LVQAALYPVLLNLVAAGLALGVAAAAIAGRPALGLRGPLLAFDLGVLLFALGDAVRRLAPDPGWDQIGLAVLHTGMFPMAAACWVLALRYAQLQGRAFTRLGSAWVRGPAALAAVAWAVAVTHPWHGLVLVPGVDGHDRPLAVGYLLALVGAALPAAAVVLLASLARQGDDPSVRRNALAMAVSVAVALCLGILAALAPTLLPIDPTVLGLCGTTLVFLFASHRTRLFQLLPVAAREVLRHSRDGMLLASPGGRLVYVNPAAAEMLALRSELHPPSLYALLDERLREPDGAPLEARALVARLLGQPGGPSDAVACSPGGERWLRIHPTAIPGRSGATAAISLQLSDVTEERRAAAALLRARDELERRVAERTAELRQSEERYRLVSELSSDTAFGCWLRPDGTVEMRWLSRDVKLFTGRSAEPLDVQGWSRRLNPEDRERVVREATSVAVGRPCDLEFRIFTDAGEEKWLELHARAVDPAPDGTLYVVGALRDISERKRADAERWALELRVQEAQRLDSLGGLAGGIAHDFNNLLSIVLGNATLGLQDLPGDSPARGRLERIRAAAEYATQLTDQMLTYAGRARPKLSALDVSRVVEDLLDLLEASARPCRLVTELVRGLPPIDGDETQIRQVLMNLVSNAQQASHESRGPIRVRAGRMRADRAWLAEAVGAADLAEGDYVYLEVEDFGQGMDATTRARVFEPFFSARSAGRGLGLPVVLGIVRAHGGAIRVDTAPGRGAVFRAVFPFAAAARAAAPTPRAHAEGDAGEVLVCDDDPGVRELATEFLTRAGFRVRAAACASEAIAAFDAHAPTLDAVLLDLRLPDADAASVLRAFAARRAGVPVILATGHAEEIVERELAGARPARRLRKPYAPEALVEAVREAIAAARA